MAELVGTIAFGLAESAEDFPDCPVGVEVLQEALARYNRAKEIDERGLSSAWRVPPEWSSPG